MSSFSYTKKKLSPSPPLLKKQCWCFFKDEACLARKIQLKSALHRGRGQGGYHGIGKSADDCDQFHLINYRKRPCISRTFFQKIEAKNRECGLSMDTSMFGVLKNLLNVHKTSKGAEKET